MTAEELIAELQWLAPETQVFLRGLDERGAFAVARVTTEPGAFGDEVAVLDWRPIVTQEAEPAYMRCHVCKKHRSRSHREACGHDTGDGAERSRSHREACGHDTGDGAERRWYCSRKCFDR